MIPSDRIAEALLCASREGATEIRVVQCDHRWLDAESASNRLATERVLIDWASANSTVRIMRLFRHDVPAESESGQRKIVLDRWLASAIAWSSLIGPDASERIRILRVVDDQLCKALHDGVSWPDALSSSHRPDATLRNLRSGSPGTTRTNFVEFSSTHTPEFERSEIYASIASL